MPIQIALLVGAAVGSLGGWLIGRSRLCGANACRAKGPQIFSILAGAVFGAAVAWYFVN